MGGAVQCAIVRLDYATIIMKQFCERVTPTNAFPWTPQPQRIKSQSRYTLEELARAPQILNRRMMNNSRQLGASLQ